ncbi:MAG: squalene synthase HpnC [Chloroflexota bacterium]|nr:squalene synthase HpnC [Chloroflexota bacterium]
MSQKPPTIGTPRPRPPVPDPRLAEQFTRRLARSHYENFLVVSWLLPKRLHQPMFNVYAYCRGVDDLGDEAEGDRLALLDDWERELEACYGGNPTAPTFVALAETVRQYDLPMQLFRDLIQANRQDQTVSRYNTYADLEAYCRLSANPVGRLVLCLFGYRDEPRLALSDATCTALQLANFWQDVASDYHQRGRIYLPLEDLRRFGCAEEGLAVGRIDPAWRELMAFEVERARRLFHEGLGLVDLVDRRLRIDLRLFSLGGVEILDRIEAAGYDVLSKRPHVPAARQLVLLMRALVSGPVRSPRGG